MIDYSYIYDAISDSSLKPWLNRLPSKVDNILKNTRHGDLAQWHDTLNRLPSLKASSIDLNNDSIRIGTKDDCDENTRNNIERSLRDFHPWRKGPFDIFGVHIETEWRSDLKWNRLKDHIQPLKNRLVLDVGSGSGYYSFRMGGAGAKLTVGIEPTLLYVMQFKAVNHFIKAKNVSVLPIGIDDMPKNLNRFDTVFSMGLLYHRHSPIDHILHLKSLLRCGGELVLESLVIDGGNSDVLAPDGRYAKMPNVWFIPSPAALGSWLQRCGFKNIRCIDITKTETQEQRVTDWMGFESLSDFLDPNDSNLTVEGYPAPKRAIFLASND